LEAEESLGRIYQVLPEDETAELCGDPSITRPVFTGTARYGC